MRLAIAGTALLFLAACGDNDALPGEATPAEESAAADRPDLPGEPAAPAERVTAANGQQYVDLVGASDLFEIDSARLAMEKSQDQGIRAFAQMLLREHGLSTQRLAAAARTAQPRLNARPSLNRAQRADLAALRGVDAAAFDRLFLDQQMRAHETALGLVTDYASAGDVEPLRVHASQVAGPILQHLQQVRSLSEGSVAEQLNEATNRQ